MSQRLCLTLTVLVWTANMYQISYSFVYTSSKKIEEMALEEEQILKYLHAAIQELGNRTMVSCFSKFYHERLTKARERQQNTHLLGYLRHPNGAYNMIKQFAADYKNIRSILNVDPSPLLEYYLNSIATVEDVQGSLQSFIRLQDVYNLTVSDMVNGNYFGFTGPQLTETDIADIGEAAFNDNQWYYAISWLQEALKLFTPEQPTVGLFHDADPRSSKGRILAVLGRAYLKLGNKVKAEELFRAAMGVSAIEQDSQLSELERELKIEFKISLPYPTDQDFKRLCSLQNKITPNKFDPRISCSYKEGVLPYYRIKQELLSISPYVTLFYDVIADEEIDALMQAARKKLYRGYIQVDGKLVVDHYRTSDIAFLEDMELPAVLVPLSKRVAAITGLNTAQFVHGSSYNAEPYQVVNYGMGGQYGLHYDHFEEKYREAQKNEECIKYGGDRLATFLIYLTDVERGGSTVFNQVDLAVSPVKKMALFWYGYKPSGELDIETRHAGCPVVVGHKWVSNKWIWVHGNTFTRRCGLTPDATQLDIEPHMRKGWV